jgi:acyl-CoA hydrolase
MSWMEQCAYISASRLRGHHHLTAGMDSVLLARTTKVGDVLYVTAQVGRRPVTCRLQARVRSRRAASTGPGRHSSGLADPAC